MCGGGGGGGGGVQLCGCGRLLFPGKIAGMPLTGSHWGWGGTGTALRPNGSCIKQLRIIRAVQQQNKQKSPPPPPPMRCGVPSVLDSTQTLHTAPPPPPPHPPSLTEGTAWSGFWNALGKDIFHTHTHVPAPPPVQCQLPVHLSRPDFRRAGSQRSTQCVQPHSVVVALSSPSLTSRPTAPRHSCVRQCAH